MALSQQAVVSRLVADRSKLLAYTWSIVRDSHAAEDVFQEVVLAAMSHADEVKDADHLMMWARRAARLRGIDWLRRQKRQPLVLDAGVLDLLEADWGRMDAQKPQLWLDALRACVAKLTDYARQLLTLRYVEGLSGIEIGRQLGRPPKTIYVALGRTYRQLEDCIQRQADGLGDDERDDDSTGRWPHVS
jgi:RNA polymerase sigma-70 factor, ECF subfamily